MTWGKDSIPVPNLLGHLPGPSPPTLSLFLSRDPGGWPYLFFGTEQMLSLVFCPRARLASGPRSRGRGGGNKGLQPQLCLILSPVPLTPASGAGGAGTIRTSRRTKVSSGQQGGSSTAWTDGTPLWAQKLRTDR